MPGVFGDKKISVSTGTPRYWAPEVNVVTVVSNLLPRLPFRKTTCQLVEIAIELAVLWPIFVLGFNPFLFIDDARLAEFQRTAHCLTDRLIDLF